MTFSQRIYNELRKKGYFTGSPLAYCASKVRSHNDAEDMMRRLQEA